MTRLRYRAVLEPVPRAWFEDAVGLVHDTLAEYLGGAHLPLVDGWALRPGARYASADRDVRVTLESWSRDGETAGEVHINDSGFATTCLVRLDSAAAPRTVGLDGDSREITLGRVMAVTGSLRADLELWWTGTSQPGGDPAIVGWVEVSVLHARFAVAPAPAPDGRWRVTVAVKLRGRGLFRPVAAAGLLVARRKIRRELFAKLDEFAQRWNQEFPALRAMPPDQLRELVTAELDQATVRGPAG